MEKKIKASNETERVERLAGNITSVFKILFIMIPDLDLLKEMQERNSERLSMATDGAVLLEAMGKSSEEAENKARLETRRTEALINLIEVLVDTEKNRQEFLEGVDIDKLRKYLAKLSDKEGEEENQKT